MTLSLVLCSLFYFVAVLMQIKTCNGCLEKERIGLLAIKAYFVAQGGDTPESELESWVDERRSNCCSWDRVKCGNVSTGHVTELSLYGLLWQDYEKLSLVINFSLFSPFQELVILDLSENMINNWIHDEGLLSLKKLEVLNLTDNRLNSSILLCLNGLTSLRTLNLKSSMIDSSFPAQGFSNMKKLENLDLSDNWLNGNALSNLNVLASLQTLRLSKSSIDGPFHARDFVNFSRLELLDLRDTGINGTLNIEGFENLKNLKVLDLSQNYMVGSIQGLCKMKDLVELSLSDNMFGVKLPECLHNLTSLQLLDLSHNFFNGNFPSFTTNLTSLAYFSLFGNYLQGSFSLSTLANHSKLEVLSISSKGLGAQIETENTSWLPKFQLKFLILQSCNLNKDKGSVVPSFLMYQHDLQYIDLSHNKLVGEFPSWLINNNTRLGVISLRNNSLAGIFRLLFICPELYHLDLSSNNISGILQKDIGNLLPGIVNLNLSMNIFEGKIPTSIGEIEEMTFLDLSHNHFSGELPENLVSNYNLVQLKLSNNFLKGNISKFAYGSSLEALYLSNNNFSGTLEGILKNNTLLSVLDISNNSISGAIPNSIGKCSAMSIFRVAENQLDGQIPFEISNISNLEFLDLSQNRLFGSIPYFNLPSLRLLYLQNNALSGFIPHTLSESSKLVILDLRDNKLFGYIPHWINKLSTLRVLLLGGNNFGGHIPIQLCQLEGVSLMDLSRNMINGSIPSCLGNLLFGMGIVEDRGPNFNVPSLGYWNISVGKILLNASVQLIPPINVLDTMEYDEQVNVEFRTKHNYYSYKGVMLEDMNGLDLSCNMLTGIIPHHIGNLQQLRVLNLSHNFLSGPIPISFSNLSQMESLDLSFNNLSGQIPSQVTQLNFLSTFNVSYNNLSGIPPSSGQFANFDEDNYRGNSNLCGPLLEKKGKDPSTSPPTRRETTLDMVAFFWSFGVAYVSTLLVFLIVLCINVEWQMAWFYYMGKLLRLCFPSFPY